MTTLTMATHKIDDLIPQDTKILIQEVDMKQEYEHDDAEYQ